MNVWKVIGLLVIFMFADAAYSLWTLAIIQRKPFKAAVLAAFIYLFAAVGTISYVENILYVIPIFLGGGVGTYFVVRYSK